MRHLQSAALLTGCVLVHEAYAAHVRDHPSVVECRVERRDEVSAECHEQHEPHLAPSVEVVSRISRASPFSSYRDHVALAVELSESPLSVEEHFLEFCRAHLCSLLELESASCEIVSASLDLLHAEAFFVCFLEHLNADLSDFHQVLSLRLEVHVVFSAPEYRIRIMELSLSCVFLYFLFSAFGKSILDAEQFCCQYHSLLASFPCFLDLLDLKRFHESLESCSELSGSLSVVQSVDRKDRPAVFL